MSSVKDMFDSIEVDESETSSEKREMDRVSDGTYKAVVTDFSVFNTEAGDYYVSWWFEVIDGAASGAQLQSFSGVSPHSVKFIKRSVQRITGKYPAWGDMFDAEAGRTGILRNEVVGKTIQITQKTNNKSGKDYVNVYVDKLLKSSNGVAPTARLSTDESPKAADESPAPPAPQAKLPGAPSPGSGTPSPDDDIDVDDLF